MSKSYLDGRPTTAGLRGWSTYGQLGTEADEPTRESKNPDGVRHLDGSTYAAQWSKGDPKQHKFPSLGAGSDSGQGRVALSKAQGRKRGA